MDCCRVVLAALYLREDESEAQLSKRHWPAVVGALRRANPDIGGAAAVLADAGLWAEAAYLQEPQRMARAEACVERGEALTAEDTDYPVRWLGVLGAGAPPALWRSGPMPEGRFVAIVGSRVAKTRSLRFAEACAAEVVRLGFSVASGGAQGCDRAAASGADGRLLEILPLGLGVGAAHADGRCLLSMAAPGEGFSGGLAIERNTLVYALSDLAVVAEARLRTGGSWNGAVDAMRRRLTRVAVRDDPSSPGHAALAALGARVLARPSDLSAALDDPGMQPRFVRERPRGFGLAWSGGAAVL